MNRTVQEWLKRSYNINISEDWLATCIEFIHQETLTLPPSVEEMKRHVLDQWLMSDLSEIGNSVIPDEVYSANLQKIILPGIYPLQMISIVDISTPLYGQLQKFQSNGLTSDLITFSDTSFEYGNNSTQHNNTYNNNNRSSRMLKLDLSDGQRNIEAIEYTPIRVLNKDLPSGTKILIKGPVVCRRQMLLLQEENVCLMGGEVDDLMVVNNPLMNLQSELERNRQVLNNDGIL